KGITVIDPLLSAEPAKEALDLYYANRGKKPVVGGGFSPTPRAPQAGAGGGGGGVDLKYCQMKIYSPFAYKKENMPTKIAPGTSSWAADY
ncbi:MBL fold metallo-hydrolase, partial [Enterobacter intestinihominis]